MNKRFQWLFPLKFFLILLTSWSGFAEETGNSAFTEPVQVQLIHEEKTVKPGRPFWVALVMEIEDEWHSYWKNPGDSGMAPRIEWSLPEGFTAEPLLWPYPQKFFVNSAVGFGYENNAVFLSRIHPPEELSSDTIDIGAAITWVVCNSSTCMPGVSEASISLNIDKKTPQTKNKWKQHFTEARARLPKTTTEVLVQSREDRIELHLKAGEDLPSESVIAEFFPEDNAVIDHKIEAVLKRDESEPSKYTLCLKKSEFCTEETGNLKGVLVLKTEEESSQVLEAIELDVPLSLSTEKATATNLAYLAAQQGIKSSQEPKSSFEGGLGLTILFAFLGGMILNLMPCVLPVVSFKILSFVKMAGKSRRKTFNHGLTFSLGVLVSFWVLAGVMLALQAYGRSVGWGFQLQEPLFVAILAAVILVFGLSLFGLFELGTTFASWVGTAQSKSQSKSQDNDDEGYVASFASGILATAVATPCTGPFLGSAIGVAVTLPTIQAMLIFTSLGVGMASPYLLLAGFPELLRFMPKPGNWMVTLKEFMGFIMLATVLWLIWVFSAQTNSFAVFMLLSAFFFLAFGCWVLGKWGSPIKKSAVRLTSYAVTLSCLVLASGIIYSASTASWVSSYAAHSANETSNTVWEQFSPARVAELRAEGRPILVDFTAKWCLICQVNHAMLSTAEVSNKLDSLGVVRMKADWTRKDDSITEELRKFGRNGVPLYLLYGTDPQKPPVVLPQTLTPGTIINHLEKIEQIDNVASS